MLARTYPGRPGFQVLNLLAAAVGLAFLYSCASPSGYQRSGGGLFRSAPAMPPPVLDTVQVHELRGTATVQLGTQRLPLKAESEINENQPVQVGARSNLRLAIGQRALLDLGPGSRVVIHKLPRDGKGEERETWLRLEQGYLRVVWSDEKGDTPMEVSFGRWAAVIGAGEHFFDSRGSAASACSTSGAMRLSGVPEWTPRSLSEPCVTLEPNHAPVEIALREKDWNTLRTKRRLQPTLARAADQQATQAVASLKRDGIRQVAWKPATSPGAFSADRLVPAPPSAVTTFSTHTPPVIQIPADPLPMTPRAQAVAVAPPSPAIVVTHPEPVRVLAPEDVPTVESSHVVMAAPHQPTPAVVAPLYDPAEAQALLDSAPTAAGPMATEQPTPVAAPTLKWTEDLQTDTASLSPVTVAPPEPAVMTPEPAAVTATTPDPAAQIAYSPEPTEALAPMVETPVVAPPPASDRAEWIVNVATYASPELAQQHAQQLVAQDFKATVRPETVRGRSSYRVVIEGIPSEAAAQSAVADLGTRWGVRSAWAMRKR